MPIFHFKIERFLGNLRLNVRFEILPKENSVLMSWPWLVNWLSNRFHVVDIETQIIAHWNVDTILLAAYIILSILWPVQLGRILQDCKFDVVQLT